MISRRTQEDVLLSGVSHLSSSENKKALPELEELLRSRADSNRRTRFCRPLPSHSATRPFLRTAKLINLWDSLQVSLVILCKTLQTVFAKAVGISVFKVLQCFLVQLIGLAPAASCICFTMKWLSALRTGILLRHQFRWCLR